MAINQNDKLLGAYVHVPIVGSTLVPIIVWLLYREQKDKADLVFQAKQAAIFQVIMGVLIGLFAVLGGILSVFMPMIGLLFSFLILPLVGIFGLYALFAAWKVYSGEDFRYAVIGSMLKK
jgi:uncharacterized Tic20 family protein